MLRKLSYRAEPEGVLAVVEIPNRTMPPDPTLVLVAVGIEKPGNLGAMARTADAAGADAILVAEARSDPWNPNAIRASTGAVFTLPILDATHGDIAALAVQRSPRRRCDNDAHRGRLHRADRVPVGAEDAGLPDECRELADTQVEIPMRGAAADTLNAAPRPASSSSRQCVSVVRP